MQHELQPERLKITVDLKLGKRTITHVTYMDWEPNIEKMTKKLKQAADTFIAYYKLGKFHRFAESEDAYEAALIKDNVQPAKEDDNVL